MSVLRLKDGVPLVEDGKLGLSADCCCCSGPCPESGCPEPCICRCPDTDANVCSDCCPEPDAGLCPCPGGFGTPVFLSGSELLTPGYIDVSTTRCKYYGFSNWSNGCCTGDVGVEADICCATFDDTVLDSYPGGPPPQCMFGCAEDCTLTNITITFTDNLPCDCPGTGPDTSLFQYFYCFGGGP